MPGNFTDKRWHGDGTGNHDHLTTQCLTCGRVISRSVDSLYEQGWNRATPPTVFAVELAVDLAVRLHATTHKTDPDTIQYVPTPDPF
jgi:hypothetical protein